MQKESVAEKKSNQPTTLQFNDFSCKVIRIEFKKMWQNMNLKSFILTPFLKNFGLGEKLSSLTIFEYLVKIVPILSAPHS